MALADEKVIKQLSNGLNDSRVSPAMLAYAMLRENRVANESFIQFFINYINIIAETKLIPAHLEEVRQFCLQLRFALEELGLTEEKYGRMSPAANEYVMSG